LTSWETISFWRETLHNELVHLVCSQAKSLSYLHTLQNLLFCKSETIMKYFFSEFNVTPQKFYKIIVIGDPTVGKTSFVQRYVQNSFKKDYKGTVGVDFALKIVKLSDTQTIRLQLWDIAGKSFILWIQHNM